MAIVAVLASSARVHAVCSIIPAPARTWEGDPGVIDRPFASPGDPIEIRCSSDPANEECAGLAADDVVVSVVFKPSLVDSDERPNGSEPASSMIVLGRQSALDSRGAARVVTTSRASSPSCLRARSPDDASAPSGSVFGFRSRC